MRFTLIDIGSNSVKCNLYEKTEGGLSTILTRSATVGIIRYIDAGALSDEGIAILLSTIREYRDLGKALGAESTFCVATASLRGLSNGDVVTSRIESEGCLVRIISGEEEAKLGFASLCASIPNLAPQGILVDLGGASTEITAFSDGQITRFISLPFGCLRLYLRHVSGVFPDKSERKAIKKTVEEHLSSLSWLNQYGGALYLIGGSAKTAGKVLASRAELPFRDGFRVNAETFSHFAHTYRDPGKKKIRTLIGAAPDRLHTFLPGIIALECINKAATSETITISFAGVRDGMAQEIMKGNWNHEATET